MRTWWRKHREAKASLKAAEEQFASDKKRVDYIRAHIVGLATEIAKENNFSSIVRDSLKMGYSEHDATDN